MTPRRDGFEDRARADVRNGERITPPALDGTTLTFWVVRGSMDPEAERVVVDVARGVVTGGP